MFIYDCLWRKAHFDRLPHQIKQQPMTRGDRKKRHSKLHHHIESRPYSYYLWAWNPSIDGHVTNEKWQKRRVLLNKLMLRCECNILVDISISIFMPKMHWTPYMHWYAYSQCLYGCTLHIAHCILNSAYCKLHIYTSIRTFTQREWVRPTHSFPLVHTSNYQIKCSRGIFISFIEFLRFRPMHFFVISNIFFSVVASVFMDALKWKQINGRE